MSVRAYIEVLTNYEVKENKTIKTFEMDNEPLFNCWHDELLFDLFNDNGYSNYDQGGIMELTLLDYEEIDPEFIKKCKEKYPETMRIIEEILYSTLELRVNCF